VDQLVGASEIAKRTGVKRTQAVHGWRQRYPDFPQPVAKLDMGLVWYWPEVERWARATGRLRER
jgi:predicted DNA-binding transcriptional regulator AlpA